jgi:addiction module HigA family antidote
MSESHDWRIVQRKLKLLDAAVKFEDLAASPGNRLERLRGDQAGRPSIRVNDQYASRSAGRMEMPTKSASRSITRGPNWLGPAIPPGEILLEEYLKPMGIGQVEAARRLDISLNRLNETVLGKRGITADTALRTLAAAEDLDATLDATASRLGPPSSHAA